MSQRLNVWETEQFADFPLKFGCYSAQFVLFGEENCCSVPLDIFF